MTHDIFHNPLESFKRKCIPYNSKCEATTTCLAVKFHATYSFIQIQHQPKETGTPSYLQVYSDGTTENSVQ